MVIVNKRFLIFLIIGIGTIILLAVIWNALINRREQSDIVLPDTVEVESRTEEQYVIINTLDKEVAEEIEAELESQGKKGIPQEISSASGVRGLRRRSCLIILMMRMQMSRMRSKIRIDSGTTHAAGTKL